MKKMSSVSEQAAEILDAAGQAGGVDEVRRIAKHGWPAREGQSAELCEVVQALASAQFRDEIIEQESKS